MRQALTVVLLLSVGTLMAGPLAAADWGDLTGTFVYDGKAPAAQPLTITKDQEFCGRHELVDESLVVGPHGGIRDVIVYLYVGRGDKEPPLHPDYAKTASDKVRLDNRGCRFDPHIVLLRTSQTLLIGNPDPVGHNTKIDALSNPAINPLIPAGGQLEHKFLEEERLPAIVSCNIHPWMTARVVVRNSPYFAVSDEEGKFTIKNVPTGKWTFQFYHERAGYVQDVNVNGKATNWSRGRVDLTIKSGPNDLGTVKLAPGVFAK